jgi:hypothetical protein
MQRFPDHWARPSEERITYASHRRTGESLRLPISASGPKAAINNLGTTAPIPDIQLYVTWSLIAYTTRAGRLSRCCTKSAVDSAPSTHVCMVEYASPHT